MEKKYIDAESFKETLDYYIKEAGWSAEANAALGWCKEFVDSERAADVVPVVRCKDCKHGILDGVEWWQCCKDADYDEETRTWHGFISHNKADWFCADGQRRE